MKINSVLDALMTCKVTYGQVMDEGHVELQYLNQAAWMISLAKEIRNNIGIEENKEYLSKLIAEWDHYTK